MNEKSVGDRRKGGILARFKAGLSKTRQGLAGRMGGLLRIGREIDEELLEELEEIMVSADVGVRTTEKILQDIREGVERREIQKAEDIRPHIKRAVLDIIKPMERTLEIDESERPRVIMVVGVNGVGKTTTIAKLARTLSEGGERVLLAAADTFRAAAIEQLEVWADRVGAGIVKGVPGGDASAVVYDAIQSARARGFGIIIADTAGRLHTSVNLMEEMKKMKRVIAREVEGAPHEVLLVLDATTGQNAIAQARTFDDGIGVTGIAITKLDGTAKGGVLVAIADEVGIPIKLVGIGEGMDDLKGFDAAQFVEALFEE